MTSLMANYNANDREYQALKYRTQCGQAQQQSEIDQLVALHSDMY